MAGRSLLHICSILSFLSDSTVFPFQHIISWKKLDIWADYYSFSSCGRLQKLWFVCTVVSGSRVTSSSQALVLTPTSGCSPSSFSFKSCSKLRSFSCFVCVPVFLSLMWFFYPRASSGTLSQESKCGTPVTALPSPPHTPFVYVRACLSMCVHKFRKKDVAHEPSRLCTSLYAWVGWSYAESNSSPHGYSFPPESGEIVTVLTVLLTRSGSGDGSVWGFWCPRTGSWIFLVVLACLSSQPGCCSRALMSAPVCPCRL